MYKILILSCSIFLISIFATGGFLIEDSYSQVNLSIDSNDLDLHGLTTQQNETFKRSVIAYESGKQALEEYNKISDKCGVIIFYKILSEWDQCLIFLEDWNNAVTGVIDRYNNSTKSISNNSSNQLENEEESLSSNTITTYNEKPQKLYDIDDIIKEVS